jgi:hypothetical protein
MNTMIRCMVITPMDLSEDYYKGEAMDITMKVFVGTEGHLNICFSETFLAESENEEYINDAAYPNSAEVASDKKDLWMSMFTRHIRPAEESDSDSIYICAQ